MILSHKCSPESGSGSETGYPVLGSQKGSYGSGLGTGDPGSGSGSGRFSSGSETEKCGSGSGTRKFGSGSGTGNPGLGSRTGNPGLGLGTGNPGLGLGTGNPGLGSGTGKYGLDSGSGKSRGQILMRPVYVEGTETFSCTLCPMRFSTKDKCTAHIRLVHLTQGKECKFCGREYKKIKQHISDVHCNLDFECDICNKVFASNRLLNRHIEAYHQQEKNTETRRRTRCEVCKIDLDSRKRVQHIELSHLLPLEFNVPCPVCRISVKFLPFHFNKCHKKINIKRDLFPCRKCRRYFLTLTELRTHDVNHVSYSCQLCGLLFGEFLQLGWHCMQEHNQVFNLGARNRSKRVGTQEDLNNLRLYDFSPGPDGPEDEDSNEVPDEDAPVPNEDDPAALEGDEESSEETSKQDDSEDCEISTFIFHVDENETVTETSPLNTADDEYGIKSNPAYYVPSNPDTEDEEQVRISGNTEPPPPRYICSRGLDRDPEPIPVQPLPRSVYPVDQEETIQHTTIIGEEFFYIDEAEYMVHEDLTSVHEVKVDELDIEEVQENIEAEEETESRDEAENTEMDEQIVNKLRVILAAEKKINISFPSKQEVPRDLRNIELEIGDETLLQSLARDEGIQLKDLSRLQVCPAPENREERVPKNRFKFTNSRQAHVCPYCRVILKTRYTLQSHISVKHFNLKPCICTLCRKYFACNSDLKKHMQIHEPETMVNCDVCSKEFRKGYLARHNQFAHSRAANTPADCDVCGKSFKKREIMMQHRRRIHTSQIL